MLAIETIIVVTCVGVGVGVGVSAHLPVDVKSQVHGANTLVEYLEENHIRGSAVSAYEGSMAQLACVGATERGQKLSWTYAESIHNLTFTPMEEKETAVDNGNLTIFYARQPDSGLYQCSAESTASSLVVLQVVDCDPYDVVKPPTSRGPYPSPARQVTPQLMIFSRWSTWSRCSRCDCVGRQRRYGMCYVRYTEGSNVSSVADDTSPGYDDIALKEQDIKLFKAFPGGIPCRSNLLPESVISLPPVVSRKNEIMMGLCKVPCKSDMFEVESPGGEAERANNSDGVYSLRQGEPAQPPPPARDIIFAPKGADVLVKCPGTTLRDVPVTWRVGSKEVVPRELDESTAGRIHLNARDHIVMAAAQYTDSNVYSCWQERSLAGVVKLKVFEDTRAKYGRQLTLLALLCCLCLVYRPLHHMYCYRRRSAL